MSYLISTEEEDNFIDLECNKYDEADVLPSRLLSQLPQAIVPNLTCVNPLGELDTIAPQVNELLPTVSCSRNTNYFEYDELETASPDAAYRVLGAFGHVLRHDYLPVNTERKNSEIAAAFGAPVIGFLSTEAPRVPSSNIKMLLLGAANGKNIRRLQRSFNGSISVVVHEESDEHRAHVRQEYPRAMCLFGKMKSAIKDMVNYGPYDIILADMSVHSYFGLPSSALFIRALPELLKKHGVFMGTYVDVSAVRMSGLQQQARTGHSVTYVSETRSEKYNGEFPIDGLATISVAGRLWQDPILDAHRLYAQFENIPLALNVFDGHTFIIGNDNVPPIYRTPEFLTARACRPELSFLRCVLINHPVYPNHYCLSPPISLVDSKSTGLQELSTCYHFNKGRPLAPYETQYLDYTSTWIAEKKDGIMVKIVHKGKSLEVVTGSGGHKIKGFTSPVNDEFVLQAEMIPTESTNAHFEKDGKYWLVVTDVLRAPWGVTGSFISRWLWLERLYGGKRPTVVDNGSVRHVNWPFVLQSWTRVGTAESLRLLRHAKEGVVLQSITAPPGPLKAKTGSARYVKRRYTIDVEHQGQIVEKDIITGAIIRPRPDKSRPNPPSVVDSVRTAVTYGELQAYLFYHIVGVYAADIRRIATNVLERVPMTKWEPGDVLWLYKNCNNPYLETLFPSLSESVKNLIPLVSAAIAATYERQVAQAPDTTPIDLDNLPESAYSDGLTPAIMIEDEAIQECMKLMPVVREPEEVCFLTADMFKHTFNQDIALQDYVAVTRRASKKKDIF